LSLVNALSYRDQFVRRANGLELSRPASQGSYRAGAKTRRAEKEPEDGLLDALDSLVK